MTSAFDERGWLTDNVKFHDSKVFASDGSFLGWLLKVNIPEHVYGYQSGNGEGCWALITDTDLKARYDRDEQSPHGKTHQAWLLNQSIMTPLSYGAPIEIELRGQNRPVVSWEWMLNRKVAP